MSLEAPETISLFIAFSAGLLSFVSPCVLPLVPSYVSYITGLSLGELTSENKTQQVRRTTLYNSLLFILGFSLVFIAFGASATYIGQSILVNQNLIRKTGGILVIVLGFSILGIFKIPFLMTYKQYQWKSRPAGAVGTVLVGVTFAAGWTPCVGPILGTILLYASTTGSIMTGIQLLAVYSMGLALPLLITSLSVNYFLTSFKKISKYMWLVSWVSGLFLIAIGLMIFTNSFTMLTAWLTNHGIGWYIGQ